MCMGFAKDIKAWVCLTEQNQRDGMLQAWAESMAGMDSQAVVFPGNAQTNNSSARTPISALSVATDNHASQS